MKNLPSIIANLNQAAQSTHSIASENKGTAGPSPANAVGTKGAALYTKSPAYAKSRLVNIYLITPQAMRAPPPPNCAGVSE